VFRSRPLTSLSPLPVPSPPPPSHSGVDSDNDGWTNGWELGDPCGVWYYSPHSAPHPCWSDDISHPGNSSSVPLTRTLDWNAACGYNPCERPDVVSCTQEIERARADSGADDKKEGGGHQHAPLLGVGGAGQHKKGQGKGKGEHRTRGGHLHEARGDARAAQAALFQEAASATAATAGAPPVAFPHGGHGQCNSGGGSWPPSSAR
jgi:hypothetical protein